MCGLAGILRFDDQPIEAVRLERMLEQLRQRGPDGRGVRQCGRVNLVHTRLAIVDLPGGGQPMVAAGVGAGVGSGSGVGPSGAGKAAGRTESGELGETRGDDAMGELTLVFNGEIYNHRHLRAALSELGHTFATDHSDSEVLLHGYRQWGPDLARHIHGMFALAIWDKAARRLYLCRDRMGKKPLSYRWSESRDELVFGSTVATLVAGTADREALEADPQAMLHYLRIGYCGERGIVQAACEVPPAHWMTIEHDGRSALERYWRPPAAAPSNPEDGLGALEEALRRAVATRLDADVPVGCFLSGGIDSSIVAALAQQELASSSGRRLDTFSMRMPEARYDETPFAQAVAAHLGTRHHVLEVALDDDPIGDLERLMATMGEPLADSSLLPTYWLSRAAREHVKVALSGDGGDELFAGYDRYRGMALLARHGAWLRHLPRGLVRGGHAKSHATRLRRLLAAAAHTHPAEQYMSMVHLFEDGMIAELGVMPPDPEPANPGPACWPAETDAAAAAMRWDLANYLPHVLLRKVDRASMAVGLEVRCPLLDTEVCELACRLPRAVLSPGGRPKALLRRLAARFLPPEITRRPKMGFAIPIGPWLAGRLHEPLRQRLLDGPLPDLGFRRDAMERLLREHREAAVDHTHRLFGLLQLALWASWLKQQKA